MFRYCAFAQIELCCSFLNKNGAGSKVIFDPASIFVNV